MLQLVPKGSWKGLPKMEFNYNKLFVMQLETPFILKTNFNFSNQEYTEYLVTVLHNCYSFKLISS